MEKERKVKDGADTEENNEHQDKKDLGREASEVEDAGRNKNWIEIPVQTGCGSIFISMDREVYEYWDRKKGGMVHMHGNGKGDYEHLPVYVGYVPM